MADACSPTLDAARLRTEVSAIYAQVAAHPEGEFHFHRGAEYAVAFLGYDRQALAALPPSVTAPFAGIGNPHAIDTLRHGETVLDIGCGAGLDLLIAATRIGPEGRGIGVDMTPQMCERARDAARTSGLENVEVRVGDAEALPVEDVSVDVVLSNGVLNLVPDKAKAYAEITRVLRPGGRLLLADIAKEVALDEDSRNDIDLWAG